MEEAKSETSIVHTYRFHVSPDWYLGCFTTPYLVQWYTTSNGVKYSWWYIGKYLNEGSLGFSKVCNPPFSCRDCKESCRISITSIDISTKIWSVFLLIKNVRRYHNTNTLKFSAHITCTYPTEAALMAQSKNCPRGVNTTIEIKNHNNNIRK